MSWLYKKTVYKVSNCDLSNSKKLCNLPLFGDISKVFHDLAIDNIYDVIFTTSPVNLSDPLMLPLFPYSNHSIPISIDKSSIAILLVISPLALINIQIRCYQYANPVFLSFLVKFAHIYRRELLLFIQIDFGWYFTVCPCCIFVIPMNHEILE